MMSKAKWFVVFWNSEEIEKCHHQSPLWWLKGVGVLGTRLGYNPRPSPFFFLFFGLRSELYTEVEDTAKNEEGLVSFITWMASSGRKVDVGRRGPTAKTTHWIVFLSALLQFWTWEGTESGLKLLVWLKLFVFTNKKLAFWVYLIHIWISAPPPYIYLMSTRVMNEIRPSPFFTMSSASVYYAEHQLEEQTKTGEAWKRG